MQVVTLGMLTDGRSYGIRPGYQDETLAVP